ncbi:nuclear transport factor 2 family protein [Novosphingobium lentum]|uniref:nuclear transport factor 2 family protein n=1 Tax=Novosphingobium lentum TaxID=145287 RepID=UPI000836C900|nr:nuclear transport factor 2 family protein [Novosphingobium lentum]
MTDIEANKNVARRYMQAVVDGDIATVEALQHPDCTWWILGFGDMSRQAFIDSVRDGLLTANKRVADIIGLTAEGDRVAVEVRGEMTFPNTVYRNEYHNLLIVRDGLIVSGKEYMDTRAAAAAFAPAAGGAA